MFTPQNLAQPLSSISLGTTILRGEKIGNNGDEKWDGGGGGGLRANKVYNYGLGENDK